VPEDAQSEPQFNKVTDVCKTLFKEENPAFSKFLSIGCLPDVQLVLSQLASIEGKNKAHPLDDHDEDMKSAITASMISVPESGSGSGSGTTSVVSTDSPKFWGVENIARVLRDVKNANTDTELWSIRQRLIIHHAISECLQMENPSPETVDDLTVCCAYLLKAKMYYANLSDAPIPPPLQLKELPNAFQHAAKWIDAKHPGIPILFQAICLLLEGHMHTTTFKEWSSEESCIGDKACGMMTSLCILQRASDLRSNIHIKACMHLSAFIPPQRSFNVWAHFNLMWHALATMSRAISPAKFIRGLVRLLVDDAVTWRNAQTYMCARLLNTTNHTKFIGQFSMVILLLYGENGKDATPDKEEGLLIKRGLKRLMDEDLHDFNSACSLLKFIYYPRLITVTNPEKPDAKTKPFAVFSSPDRKSSASKRKRTASVDEGENKKRLKEADKKSKEEGKKEKEGPGLEEDEEIEIATAVATTLSADGLKCVNDAIKPKPSKRSATKYPRPYYNSLNFSDCKIICAGTFFYAHRMVLSQHTSFFEVAFKHQMTEGIDGTIDFTNAASLDVVRAFMLFAYGYNPWLHPKKVPLPDIIALSKFAQAHQVESLVQKCLVAISETIAAANNAFTLEAYSEVGQLLDKYLEGAATIALYAKLVDHVTKVPASIKNLLLALRSTPAVLNAWTTHWWEGATCFGKGASPPKSIRAAPAWMNTTTSIADLMYL